MSRVSQIATLTRTDANRCASVSGAYRKTRLTHVHRSSPENGADRRTCSCGSLVSRPYRPEAN